MKQRLYELTYREMKARPRPVVTQEIYVDRDGRHSLWAVYFPTKWMGIDASFDTFEDAISHATG